MTPLFSEAVLSRGQPLELRRVAVVRQTVDSLKSDLARGCRTDLDLDRSVFLNSTK